VNGALARARIVTADRDRFRHRSIEQRWLPWSEAPSAGWKTLVELRVDPGGHEGALGSTASAVSPVASLASG
jgi:hypothetical protein